MDLCIGLDVLYEWYFGDFFGRKRTMRNSMHEYFGVLICWLRWKGDFEERDVRMRLVLGGSN